jgi:hypothetical protein
MKKKIDWLAEELDREIRDSRRVFSLAEIFPGAVPPEMLLETCLLDLYRDDRDFDLSAERGEDDRRES